MFARRETCCLTLPMVELVPDVRLLCEEFARELVAAARGVRAAAFAGVERHEIRARYRVLESAVQQHLRLVEDRFIEPYRLVAREDAERLGEEVSTLRRNLYRASVEMMTRELYAEVLDRLAQALQMYALVDRDDLWAWTRSALVPVEKQQIFIAIGRRLRELYPLRAHTTYANAS